LHPESKQSGPKGLIWGKSHGKNEEWRKGGEKGGKKHPDVFRRGISRPGWGVGTHGVKTRGGWCWESVCGGGLKGKKALLEIGKKKKE